MAWLPGRLMRSVNLDTADNAEASLALRTPFMDNADHKTPTVLLRWPYQPGHVPVDAPSYSWVAKHTNNAGSLSNRGHLRHIYPT